jgi:hypothetical protein
LPETNGLAYFATESATMKKKSFATKKNFSSLLMLRPNKLEHLYPAMPFQPSLTFAGFTPGAYPRKKHLKVAPLGLAPALLANF